MSQKEYLFQTKLVDTVDSRVMAKGMAYHAIDATKDEHSKGLLIQEDDMYQHKIGSSQSTWSPIIIDTKALRPIDRVGMYPIPDGSIAPGPVTPVTMPIDKLMVNGVKPDGNIQGAESSTPSTGGLDAPLFLGLGFSAIYYASTSDLNTTFAIAVGTLLLVLFRYKKEQTMN